MWCLLCLKPPRPPPRPPPVTHNKNPQPYGTRAPAARHHPARQTATRWVPGGVRSGGRADRRGRRVRHRDALIMPRPEDGLREYAALLFARALHVASRLSRRGHAALSARSRRRNEVAARATKCAQATCGPIGESASAGRCALRVCMGCGAMLGCERACLARSYLPR